MKMKAAEAILPPTRPIGLRYTSCRVAPEQRRRFKMSSLNSHQQGSYKLNEDRNMSEDNFLMLRLCGVRKKAAMPSGKIQIEYEDDGKSRLWITCRQNGRHQDHEGQRGHASTQNYKGQLGRLNPDARKRCKCKKLKLVLLQSRNWKTAVRRRSRPLWGGRNRKQKWNSAQLRKADLLT